ncbi:hypothetical protein FHT76_003612 [Rhizobium sp. BK176]|nr:hypothetical protein [Rhizobium sp. BK176]
MLGNGEVEVLFTSGETHLLAETTILRLAWSIDQSERHARAGEVARTLVMGRPRASGASLFPQAKLRFESKDRSLAMRPRR